jgi:hypothetical protein
VTLLRHAPREILDAFVENGRLGAQEIDTAMRQKPGHSPERRLNASVSSGFVHPCQMRAIMRRLLLMFVRAGWRREPRAHD